MSSNRAQLEQSQVEQKLAELRSAALEDPLRHFGVYGKVRNSMSMVKKHFIVKENGTEYARAPVFFSVLYKKGLIQLANLIKDRSKIRLKKHFKETGSYDKRTVRTWLSTRLDRRSSPVDPACAVKKNGFWYTSATFYTLLILNIDPEIDDDIKNLMINIVARDEGVPEYAQKNCPRRLDGFSRLSGETIVKLFEALEPNILARANRDVNERALILPLDEIKSMVNTNRATPFDMNNLENRPPLPVNVVDRQSMHCPEVSGIVPLTTGSVTLRILAFRETELMKLQSHCGKIIKKIQNVMMSYPSELVMDGLNRTHDAFYQLSVGMGMPLALNIRQHGMSMSMEQVHRLTSETRVLCDRILSEHKQVSEFRLRETEMLKCIRAKDKDIVRATNKIAEIKDELRGCMKKRNDAIQDLTAATDRLAVLERKQQELDDKQDMEQRITDTKTTALENSLSALRASIDMFGDDLRSKLRTPGTSIEDVLGFVRSAAVFAKHSRKRRRDTL